MKTHERIRCIFVYIIYTLFICCFQVSFESHITLMGNSIDWMFVYTCLVAYFFGFRDGIIIGLSVGILRDLFSAPAIVGIDGNVINSVGIGVLTLFLVAVVSSGLFSRRISRRFLFAFVSVLICTLGYKLAGHLLIYFWYSFFADFSYSMTFNQILFESILPQVALNLFGALFLMIMLRFLGPYKKGRKPGLIDDVYENEGVSLWLK